MLRQVTSFLIAFGVIAVMYVIAIILTYGVADRALRFFGLY